MNDGGLFLNSTRRRRRHCARAMASPRVRSGAETTPRETSPVSVLPARPAAPTATREGYYTVRPHHHPTLLPRISSQPFPFRRVRRGRVRAVVRRPHRRAIASHPTPSPRDAASSSASSTAVAHLPAPPPIARASSRLDPVSPPRRRSRRRRSSSRSRDRDPPSSAPSPSAASASAA